MTDSQETKVVDLAITLLLDFVRSENYKSLKIHEKKEFDKVLNFMAQQIKRQQQEKSFNPQKFNQDLSKKLNNFNSVVQYDLEQSLARSGMIKAKPMVQKEQLRRQNVASAVGAITQNLPMPKRSTRAARFLNRLAHAWPSHAERHSQYLPRARSSMASRKNLQGVLQNEFGNYTEKLIEYTNKKYGAASTVFADYMPTEQEKQRQQLPSLINQPNVLTGDLISRAHHYPEVRDQLVIDTVSRYETRHQKDKNNELIDLCQAINGINSLRNKIDKIYSMLAQRPLREDLVDQLDVLLSIIKPETEFLAKDLKKIHDPQIKKIAKEVVKLADKLESDLPKDIRHQIEVQQRETQHASKRVKKKPPVGKPK